MRFNEEALKLSLQGVTIVASSGDFGPNDKSQCGYLPYFPASSPYVVAVGATMGPEKGIGSPEVTCQEDKVQYLSTHLFLCLTIFYFTQERAHNIWRGILQYFLTAYVAESCRRDLFQ